MQENPNIQVQKASGDIQSFSPQKLLHFLERIQVGQEEAQRIVDTVSSQTKPHTTTKEIAAHVTQLLLHLPDGDMYAARYNLKPAIRLLGPEGHNFELYVSRMFQAEGFEVEIGKTVQGKCVDHEIDVVANKGEEHHLIECKFHNREGIRSDLVVALYSHARFHDIHQSHPEEQHRHVGWLATNTKLTNQALKYIDCVGMRLLSVEKPEGNSIMEKVIREGLFPISSLDVLGPYLQDLLAAQLVMLSDIVSVNTNMAHQLGIPEAILEEAKMAAQKVLRNNRTAV